MAAAERYDLVLVGTGFASSFFLSSYLKQAPSGARVLVLERGRHDSHAWQIKNRVNTSLFAEETFIDAGPFQKPWVHTLGFGGGSNCWWGVTPRLMPNDFKMRSVYGVGVDWPVSYEDLRPHYAVAEEAMNIAGPSDGSPFPKARPYPQPPHRFTDPGRLFKQAYPHQFFACPSARARVSTPTRAACCATGTCHLCPVDAKYTIHNGMQNVYADPRVKLELQATVEGAERAAGLVSSVLYQQAGEQKAARGELVALGANALFNPHILLRSGFDEPALGRHLDEQVSINVSVDLDGVDNFQGSTSITGHGYMLYDGEHRRHHAAALMETWNVPSIRSTRSRWRQRLRLKFIYENLPNAENRVVFDPARPHKPIVHYAGRSSYAQRGMEALHVALPKLLASLPVEAFHLAAGPEKSEAHMLGTTVMGNDPTTSVVDRNLVHHRARNLLLLGGGAFPTMSPSNPTLTIAALSLWAAARLKR